MTRSEAIGAFWAWFGQNSDRYFNLKSDMETLFDEMDKQLEPIDGNLTFEFSNVRDDGKRELVISADGILESFPSVIEMVQNAPSLPLWVFVAFRPRVSSNSTIEIEGLKLSSEDIYFHSSPEDDKLGLVLYAKDYQDNSKFGTALFILLDQVLGEYDVETKIGSLEFAPLPADYQEKNLKTLLELPKVVDDYSPK